MVNPLDISTEEYRVYTYPGGTTYRIDCPVQLYLLGDPPNHSHRVVDQAGVTHRPTPGWLAISWRPRAGAPAYVA